MVCTLQTSGEERAQHDAEQSKKEQLRKDQHAPQQDQRFPLSLSLQKSEAGKRAAEAG